jgi:SH3-like domain-containing protein
MKNRMKLMTVLMLATIFLGACVPGLLNVAPVVSGPEPTVIAISTLPANTASIRGIVWHDLCALAGGEGGAPLQPSAGCVLSETGSFHANGIREADEPGLGDVLVSLGYGACGEARDHFEVRTDADGSFVFADLPAGTYCLAVDSLRPENGLLLPGQWTSPEDLGNTGVARIDVTLQGGEAKTDVNFGWDYQFLPTPESTSLRGVVNVQGLNLRVGPSGGHKILRQLAEGTQVEIQGRSENMEWLLVRLSSGTQGWVFAEYVDTQAVIASLPLKEASGGAYLAPSDIPQSRNVQVSIENNIATVNVLGLPADTRLIVTLSRPGGKDDLVVGRGSTSADGSAAIHFEMPSEWPDGSLLKGGELLLVVSSKDGKASVKVNIQYYR